MISANHVLCSKDIVSLQFWDERRIGIYNHIKNDKKGAITNTLPQLCPSLSVNCLIEILITISNQRQYKPKSDIQKRLKKFFYWKFLNTKFNFDRQLTLDLLKYQDSYYRSVLKGTSVSYTNPDEFSKLDEFTGFNFPTNIHSEKVQLAKGSSKIDTSIKLGLVFKGSIHQNQRQAISERSTVESTDLLSFKPHTTVWEDFVQDFSSKFSQLVQLNGSFDEAAHSVQKGVSSTSREFAKRGSKQSVLNDAAWRGLSVRPISCKVEKDADSRDAKNSPYHIHKEGNASYRYRSGTRVPRGLSTFTNSFLSAIGEVRNSSDLASKMSSTFIKFWSLKLGNEEEERKKRLQLVETLKTESKRNRQRIWTPALIVYDTGACTKEEHDPAKAVLYHRPRNAPTNTRTAICGQIAGVIHFCRSGFGSPTAITTRHAGIALKHYGRFVLMVTGTTKEWAESRLLAVCRLLDAATGGIPLLWKENHQNPATFAQKLSLLLDAVVLHALPDVNFEDDIAPSSSMSTSLSSGISPSSDGQDDLDPEKSFSEDTGSSLNLWRKKKPADYDSKSVKIQDTNSEGEDSRCTEDVVAATLHREFEAVPSIPLSKSGSSAFLKAQQLLEVCQQHYGVLAGSTSYRNRVLNTQVEPELGLILASLHDSECEANGILQRKCSSIKLPKNVNLYDFNMSQGSLYNLSKSVSKISTKRGGRKNLHSEASTRDLSSLRSALQNQSLHSYPSSIPPLIDKTSCTTESLSIADRHPKKPVDSLLLCAKISHNDDLLSDGRPSRSLPGSPRKIRVPTMLPDVGSDSPELRYKVLTARRPKPGTSSHNTPLKLPPAKLGILGRVPDGQNNSVPHRGNNLAAPCLKRKEFNSKADQTKSNNIPEQLCPMDKENIHSFTARQFSERSNNMDINIKNTKNKLNLHFAPDKVNKPCDDLNVEVKISREINGNLPKDNATKDRLTNSGNSFKSHIIEINDDDDASRSEESDISVLELGTFCESKENGNKMFAEATRPDSPKSDTSLTNEDNGVFEGWAESDDLGSSNLITNTVENQWTKVTLYTQRCSNMLLFLFLDNKAASSQGLIYDLYELASSVLPEIEANLVKIMEMSEEMEGETFLRKSYSVLTALDLPSLHTPLIIEAHRDFVRYPNISEITVRDNEKVIWGHRNGQTETFYQSGGVSRPGLPIPSDVMARIPQRAKRRLERDHGITIL